MHVGFRFQQHVPSGNTQVCDAILHVGRDIHRFEHEELEAPAPVPKDEFSGTRLGSVQLHARPTQQFQGLVLKPALGKGH